MIAGSRLRPRQQARLRLLLQADRHGHANCIVVIIIFFIGIGIKCPGVSQNCHYTGYKTFFVSIPGIRHCFQFKWKSTTSTPTSSTSTLTGSSLGRAYPSYIIFTMAIIIMLTIIMIITTFCYLDCNHYYCISIICLGR